MGAQFGSTALVGAPPPPPPPPPPPSATTWNAADKHAGISLSAGGLRFDAANTAGYKNVRGTTSRSTGKWYFEATKDGTSCGIGIASAGASLANFIGGADSGSIGYYDTGYVGRNGGQAATYAPYASGDVVMIAVDLDARDVWFGKNGVWNGNPMAGTGGLEMSGAPGIDTEAIFPIGGSDTATAGAMTANFGATPPTGFTAWNE